MRKGTFALLLTAMGAAICGLPRAEACTTPVYRYAMYRWAPAPYRLITLRRGEPTPADKALDEALAAINVGETPLANVEHVAFDISQPDALASLPADVKSACQKRLSGPLPIRLLFSPRDVELYAGELESSAVRTLVGSPQRAATAKFLADGHAGVLILLRGDNEADNSAAETMIREALAADEKELAKLKLANAGADPVAIPPKHVAGFLKIARTDTAEQWLVKMLLAIEPDLQARTEPMVFCVYGRGRALEPLVGKGITRENLADLFARIGAACSCIIKEQNPGVDLLVTHDWTATARTMALEVGPETGNEEFHVADDPRLPTVVEIGDSPMPPNESTSVVPSAATSDFHPDGPAPNLVAPRRVEQPAADSVVPQATDADVEAHSAEQHSPLAAGDFQGLWLRNFAIALGIAVAAVLALGALMFRSRGA